MNDYTIFIRGDRVDLCVLRRDDSTIIHRWHNDQSVTKYSLNKFVYPSSLSQSEEFIDLSNSQKIVTFGICVGKILIGYAGFSNINIINHNGEYFILIGNKKYWHKGIGSEVTRLLIQYGFNSLHLHRIELSVSSVNKHAMALYKKLGFHEEGRKKDACFRDGAYHDKILLSIIK